VRDLTGDFGVRIGQLVGGVGSRARPPRRWWRIDALWSAAAESDAAVDFIAVALLLNEISVRSVSMPERNEALRRFCCDHFVTLLLQVASLDNILMDGYPSRRPASAR
jgi:hypothetical protein